MNVIAATDYWANIPIGEHLWLVSPMIVLVCTMLAVVTCPILVGRRTRTITGVVAIGVIVAFVMAIRVAMQVADGGTSGLSTVSGSGMLIIDNLSAGYQLLMLGFLGCVIGLWWIGSAATERDAPEFFVLLLGSALGMVLMVSTSNLLMIVMAIEMASLPSYALVSFNKRDRAGAEGGLKYMIFGAICAAIMLYGASLLYGLAGSLNFADIAKMVALSFAGGGRDVVLVSVALLCFFAGVAFKISAVPFHFWCPDAFQAAKIEVTTWLSVVSKAAGLILLVRLVAIFCGTVGAAGLMHTVEPIAWGIAIVAAIIIEPGAGFELPTDAVGYAAKEAPGLAQTLIDIFPDNPFRAMSEGRMLQIIVFAVLLGVAMTLSGEAGRDLLRFFQSANAVVMKLVFLLMQVAPYGVFCLIAGVFANQGIEAFEQLAKYFLVVLGVLFLHITVTYPTMLVVFARLNPIIFFRKLRAPMTVAFSTASSGATLPVTLRTTQERLGVDASIASFTIPLGATINMDGTAIMQGVATVFIAQAYGISLGPSDYVMVVVTATLASIGTAGVPGVGTLMLAMVLRQMNLPVEGIGLILGVDRLLDMTRTAVNISGDAAVSCIVARSEGKLDLKVFQAP
ncbi:MAG: cation:dicarboxylase symporter family transporter [Planctomycetes bacterium]|nr:cation:dicarboxylase symporter family transporter [Planctomycetota bacterium]